jgi:hypothetical protein
MRIRMRLVGWDSLQMQTIQIMWLKYVFQYEKKHIDAGLKISLYTLVQFVGEEGSVQYKILRQGCDIMCR